MVLIADFGVDRQDGGRSRRSAMATPRLTTPQDSCAIATVNGHRVAYRDTGAGEVLLLLHGLGGSSASWCALVPKLSKRYRVIAPDLLGHGQSDEPHGDYSYSPITFATMLRDLLDTLGITKVTVVGHSLGGAVAMLFAHQHRDYCERLVLINSAGFGSEVAAGLRVLSLPGAEYVLPLIAAGSAIVSRGPSAARELFSSPHKRRVFLRTLRAVIDRRGQAMCALDRIHTIADLPTQIIGGAEDRVIPVAHARVAHAALPGSRLHVIPGAGHDAHMQCADTVADLIDDFVGGTADSTFDPVGPGVDVHRVAA